jgi:hypothetical protein
MTTQSTLFTETLDDSSLLNSGKKCLEQFGKFKKVGLWARMFAGLLIQKGDWYSTKCSLMWKLKATKSSRFYFQLVPSTHTEFCLPTLQMLPTPQASDWKGSAGPSDNWKGDSDLAVQVHEICGVTRGKTSQLNPLFVEEMMGFPKNWTTLPFQEQI